MVNFQMRNKQTLQDHRNPGYWCYSLSYSVAQIHVSLQSTRDPCTVQYSDWLYSQTGCTTQPQLSSVRIRPRYLATLQNLFCTILHHWSGSTTALNVCSTGHCEGWGEWRHFHICISSETHQLIYASNDFWQTMKMINFELLRWFESLALLVCCKW